MHRIVFSQIIRWRAVACGLALVSLTETEIHAQGLKSTYTVQDGGLSRTFEVALDQVHVRSRNAARTVQVNGLTQPDAVRLHAQLLSQTTGDEAELLLYETGRPRGPFTVRVLTKQVLVRLAPGMAAGPLAAAAGATTKGEVPYLPGHYLFESPQTAGALTLAEWLRAQPGVMSAEPQLLRHMVKKFTPDDPLFTNQWHLLNTGQQGAAVGVDINVTNVWDRFRGAGVTIGIVDDGLQGSHPDLTNNFNFAISYDYRDTDNDPSPDVTQDFHGTAVAGVAAARGSNSLGVVGVAFEASLAGIRLIGGTNQSDSLEASAMLHSNAVVFVSNNSWGPADDGQSLAAPGPMMAAALANGTANGRGGLGTIFLWAGGNGRQSGDNANYDGYANSIYTIAVGALNDRGQVADYSEPGANLVVVAPAGADGSRPQGTSTTDLTGTDGYNDGMQTASGNYADADYTAFFNGTSSATPVVSGVVALLLQANPNLGWRDVQEVLMRSATKNQPNNADWFTNSAGFRFNHDFGAGLVNAGAAVTLATNWVNLGTPSPPYSTQAVNLSLAIPDGPTNGVIHSFVVSNANLRLEHVTLTVNITHANRGDLAIDLISPAGTVSRLAERHGDTNADYADWTFMTVRNWGEVSEGTWTVRVADRAPQIGGILNSLSLTCYGTFTNLNQTTATNPPTIITQPKSRTVTQGSTVNFSVGLATNSTAPIAYQWRFNGNNISGAVNSVLVLTNVQTSAEGLYSVRVSNPFGTNISADAGLFVNAPPVVVTHPTNQSVTIGSNVTFTVVASGTGPFTYYWRLNGAPISGANNQSYTITGAQTNQAGTYDVLVENSLASVFSSNAVLTVLPPFTISPHPQSMATNVGGSATFTVGASGSGPFTYQWTFNNSTLAGQTGTSLALTGLQLTNSGNYACVVSSPLGSITSSNAVLTVFNPFTIGSASFQSGNLFQMTASGDNGRSYRLESSTNLVNWSPVVTNTVSSGSATYTDSAAAGKVLRFYRIILLP